MCTHTPHTSTQHMHTCIHASIHPYVHTKHFCTFIHPCNHTSVHPYIHYIQYMHYIHYIHYTHCIRYIHCIHYIHYIHCVHLMPRGKYTRKLICIKGYYVQNKAFHVLVKNERERLKGDQSHIWREHGCISRAWTYWDNSHSVAWLSLKTGRKIQGSTFSIGVNLSRLRSCRRCWKRGKVGCHEDKKRKHASATVPEGSLQTYLHEGILCPTQACRSENCLETTCQGSKWKRSSVLGG